MMRRTLFILAITLLLVIACKKDNAVNPSIEIIGSWSTYSYDDTFFSLSNVTADQYPCIADNTLTFKSDSTFTQTYSGGSVCNIGSSVTFGVPGQAPLTGTWHQEGNDVYCGPDHYVMSSKNGKLILTSNIVFIYNGTSYTETAVLHKK
jgi:hypothetical protein